MSQTRNRGKLLSAYEVPYLRPSNFTYVNHQHIILLTFKVELNYTLVEAWWPHGWCAQLQIKWSGLSPGWGHCVVFLGKTLYSHSASLHPGVQMGTSKYAGGNPAMD